jgi:hypothetical protein
MRSVLMPIPHQEPEFRSHFLRRSNNVALIVYPLPKSINRSLSRPAFAAQAATARPADQSIRSGRCLKEQFDAI